MRSGLRFRLIIFVALALLPPSRMAYGCESYPPPPAMKVLEAKVTPSCLHLYESWLRPKAAICATNSFPAFELPSSVVPALAIENHCSKSISIKSASFSSKVSQTAPDAANLMVETPAISTINLRRFLISKDGISCHAAGANPFTKFLYTHTFGVLGSAPDPAPDPDSIYDEPPPHCSAIVVDVEDIIRIAIPYDSRFDISGDIGSSPLSIKGRMIDPNNPDQAIPYYLEYANKGDRAAEVQLTTLYRKKKDYDGYYKWITKIAQSGEYSAQSILGKAYADGKELPKDCAKAKEWLSTALKTAAANVAAEKQSILGVNNGVPIQNLDKARENLAFTLALKCGSDFKTALSLLQRNSVSTWLASTLSEANGGNTYSQSSLKNYFGNNANALKKEADLWLKRATKNNTITWKNADQLDKDLYRAEVLPHGLSRTEILNSIFDGNLLNIALLPEDDLHYLQLAVEGGPVAQYELSRLLFSEAVKNYEKAYFWGMLSYNPDAWNPAPPEAPAAFLTDGQIAAVKKRIKEWKPD